MPEAVLGEVAKEMKQTHEKVKETHHELKTAVERIEELEKLGKSTVDVKETLEKVQDALTKSDEKHQKLADDYENLQKKLASVNSFVEENQDKAEVKEHADLFFEMMRTKNLSDTKDARMLELQLKTMYAASDPDGGYVIPKPIADRIISDIKETSPVREMATIVTIGGEEYKYLVDIQEGGAGWVSERGSRDETGTPKIESGGIPAHEMYANPFVTQKQLDDAAFDIEGWLNGKVARRFGRLEATAFVLGTGVGQPRGFMTYAAGTSWGQIEQLNPGDANTITPDSLIRLQNSLKSGYASEASFMMRRATVATVRTMKDDNGQYLWQPGLQAGEPATLLGDPIVRMADLAAVASGSLPIAYGNLRETYTIVDRLAIRILRDPFSRKPYVEFYITKRVGGDVTNFESLKILKVAA